MNMLALMSVWKDQPDGPGWWWMEKKGRKPEVLDVCLDCLSGELVTPGTDADWSLAADLGGRWARAVPPSETADRDAADLAALRELQGMVRGKGDDGSPICEWTLNQYDPEADIVCELTWVDDDGECRCTTADAPTLAEAVAAALKARDAK